MCIQIFQKKVVGKNVRATIPKGNMGYDQYTVPDTVAVEPTLGSRDFSCAVSGFGRLRPKAEDVSTCGRRSSSSQARKNLWYPEAKSRGGTLVTRAYIKDSTYSSNIQSVY